MTIFTTARALALTLSFAATPLVAEGLSFEPVAPVGLNAAATQKVAAWQAQMPAAMPAFAQNGYGAYGAFAVPKGASLEDPSEFAVMAGLDTVETAKAATLEACTQQTGRDCVLIGLLLPGDG